MRFGDRTAAASDTLVFVVRRGSHLRFNSKRSETINMQKRHLKSGVRERTQTTEVNDIYTLMSSQTATAVY